MSPPNRDQELRTRPLVFVAASSKGAETWNDLCDRHLGARLSHVVPEIVGRENVATSCRGAGRRRIARTGQLQRKFCGLSISKREGQRLADHRCTKNCGFIMSQHTQVATLRASPWAGEGRRCLPFEPLKLPQPAMVTLARFEFGLDRVFAVSRFAQTRKAMLDIFIETRNARCG